MKKIMMMLVAGLAASSMVMADDIEQIDEGTTTSGAFDGLYVGAGVGGSFLKNKAVADNFKGVKEGGEALNADSKFDVKTGNVNRFVGDVFVGYGKAISGNFYLGGELLLEFAGSKTKNVECNGKPVEFEDNGAGANTFSAKVKNKGFSPELTLKAGYVSGNNIFYAKAGIARPEASIIVLNTAAAKTTETTTKVNKIVPVIYLGAARAFCNKWNANIEVGYQFQQKKDVNFKVDELNASFDTHVKVNKGWKVRAGVAHTFSF